jgi:hypothetical protein
VRRVRGWASGVEALLRERGPVRQVLAAGLLAVALVVAGTGSLLAGAYRSERRSAVDRVVAEVTAEAALADQLLADQLTLLSGLASSDDIASGDPDCVQALIMRFDPLARGLTGGMGWADLEGRSQASAIAGPRTGISFAVTDYFRRARTGVPAVGGVSRSRVADHYIVTLAVPTFDRAGAANGVLMAGIRLDTDGAFARALRLFDNEDYFVDENGLVVSATTSVPVEPGTSWPPVPTDESARQAVGRVDAFGRRDRVIAWAPVPSAGWIAVRSIPSSDVFTSANRLRAVGAVAISGAALTGLLSVLALARRVHRNQVETRVALASGDRARTLASVLADVAATAARPELARVLVERALPTLGASSARVAFAGHGALHWEDGEPVGGTDVPGGDTVAARARDAVALDALERRRPVHAGADGTSCAPLIYGNEVIGLLEARWSAPPDPSTVIAFDTLADRVASAVRRAALAEAEHRATLVFQRSVLPATPSTIEGLAVDACYEPADKRFGAGGDWYDAVVLDEQRLMVMIGDIVGHGIESAGVMGQLSTAARTLARSGERSPAGVLRGLDDFVDDHPEAFCSSMLCAVFDLERRTLTHASAGHLPILVQLRTGGTRLLDDEPGPLLGLPAERVDVVASLDDVAVAVLYTDGLVARDEPLDRAIERMVAALGTPHDAGAASRSEELVERVMAGVPRHDDVALVTVVVEPTGPTTYSLDFDAVPTAPSDARRLVRDALGTSFHGDLFDDAQLLTSELVSNAVEHAGGKGRVVDVGPALVRISVTDGDARLPVMREGAPGDVGGRGLRIVHRLATRWGVDERRDATGKTVWFELSVPSDTEDTGPGGAG